MAIEKNFDLAIAGELNLDLILYGLPLEMETERDLLATGFVTTLGSSSAIVAHNAAMLGLRVRFATLVGDDDFGRLALERLQQAGVDLSGVVVDSAMTTGVTVLLPHGSVRHNLTYPGAISKLSCEHLDVEGLQQARHLHLCSLYLQTSLHDGLPKLLHTLRQSGTTVSLDTNDDPTDRWGEPLQELLSLVDIFMPSEGELCRMAGMTAPEQAIAEFAPAVPLMVVKRGKLGCSVRIEGVVHHVPGIRVEPVDTIGAGDSFDAGFLTACLRGLGPLDAARAGNIAGALSTQAPGGTEAFRNVEGMRRFLQEHGSPPSSAYYP